MILPTDFKEWTREQRSDFRWYENKKNEMTIEEKNEQDIINKQYKIRYITEKLSLYWINFNESNDYSRIYREYIFNEPDLKEFWWKQEILENRYNECVEKYNNIEWLYNIIREIES